MKIPKISINPGGLVLGFALLCVAVTSGVIVYMRIWETELLAEPGWCQRIIAAAKTAEQVDKAFTGCFTVSQQQLSAIAFNSHMDTGVLALSLLVLVVIVLAQATLSVSASKGGLSANIGHDNVPPAPVVQTTTTTAVVPAPTPPKSDGEGNITENDK